MLLSLIPYPTLIRQITVKIEFTAVIKKYIFIDTNVIFIVIIAEIGRINKFVQIQHSTSFVSTTTSDFQTAHAPIKRFQTLFFTTTSAIIFDLSTHNDGANNYADI